MKLGRSSSIIELEREGHRAVALLKLAMQGDYRVRESQCFGERRWCEIAAITISVS